jgi:hypothetical protein
MTRIPQPLQRLKSLIVNNFVTIRRTSKTYRNRVLYGSGMNSQTRSFEVLRTEAANIHDFGYQSNNIAKKVNWLDTVEAFLIKPRLVKIGKLKLRPFTLSEFCGHGSFLCLAMGYLTSDLLQLRIFAFSGISLSVVFQYYRPQPLWIPIKWNALFLLINGMMIAILLKDEYEATNLSEDHKLLYQSVFASKGMKAVDFMKLMAISTRVEKKRGDIVVQEDKENDRICLVKSGKLGLIKKGLRVGDIEPFQFVGLGRVVFSF